MLFDGGVPEANGIEYIISEGHEILAEKREQREELRKMANSQEGVDALKAAFPDRELLPGVLDKAKTDPEPQ